MNFALLTALLHYLKAEGGISSMKIIGLLLLAVGIIGIVLTVLLPAALGYAGIIAGVTAILTGIVFLAACNVRTSCCYERRNNNNCCD